LVNAKEFLAARARRTEDALETYVASWSQAPAVLIEAVRYSLFAGGKRLRPGLVLGACEILRGEDTPAIPAACALEMIHTYSLMHDDLPSMDNDDLRRGKPTAHRVFGEAMAILGGDALLTMAFALAAQTNDARVVGEIAQAAGVEGMVGGQVIDLESEGKHLSVDELEYLHALKTGALIRVSVRAGAMLGGASDAALDALTAYGEHVGLAFQIADDVLDVVGTEAALGKTIGSDMARDKSTYPAAVGLERARELGEESVAAAVDALSMFGPEADSFRALARYIMERDR
jgi:geranylgeranyl diphosphate synthase type II